MQPLVLSRTDLADMQCGSTLSRWRRWYHRQMNVSAVWASMSALAIIACGGDGADIDAVSDAGVSADASRSTPDASPTNGEFCPTLAAPTGATVTVSLGESIGAAVNAAAAGTTVLVEDGTYDVSNDPIWINKPGVSLRSASGNRGAVILDDGYTDNGSGGVVNVRADDVTVGEISIRRSRFHAIHVSGGDGAPTSRTRIYDVSITDPGEQAIKINTSGAGHHSDDGLIACSRIELTRAGEAFVTSQVSSNSRCYTGGVDAHEAWGWTVRDNWIEGFWCDGAGGEYLSEHAVHFWTGSRDTVVERNRLVNNTRGVGFGLGPGGRSYDDAPCGDVNNAGHYGGVVRNNFITATDPALFASDNGVQEGVSLSSACNATVVHNTLAYSQAVNSAIEWRFAETSATIENNLATGRLWDRGATASLKSNLADQATTGFVDLAAHDLHLVAGAAAIGAGTASTTSVDIDGEARDQAAPDVGADELAD